MKVTNITNKRVYLSDLRITHAGQSEGRRGEDRYLEPGQSVYLPNTSEVLRSALAGTIKKFISGSEVSLEDQVTLDAFGGAHQSVVLIHNWGFAPAVYALKQVGSTWVDATGAIDIVHNSAFTQVTITNATGVPLTFLIRLL